MLDDLDRAINIGANAGGAVAGVVVIIITTLLLGLLIWYIKKGIVAKLDYVYILSILLRNPYCRSIFILQDY